MVHFKSSVTLFTLLLSTMDKSMFYSSQMGLCIYFKFFYIRNMCGTLKFSMRMESLGYAILFGSDLFNKCCEH